VVDKKRIMGKKRRADEEERHKGSLTHKKPQKIKITNLNLTKIGFVRKFRPKRFHKIGSRPRQIYWLIIFWALFIYTITLLVNNVNQYLQFDVITSTDLDYSSNVTFPAITICNQNRLI
jgi:hypothetical protein